MFDCEFHHVEFKLLHGLMNMDGAYISSVLTSSLFSIHIYNNIFGSIISIIGVRVVVLPRVTGIHLGYFELFISDPNVKP